MAVEQKERVFKTSLWLRCDDDDGDDDEKVTKHTWEAVSVATLLRACAGGVSEPLA